MKQKVTELEYKSGLTPVQEQTAALLASGKTITDTATDLQLSRATIYRLLQDDVFLAYYNLLCREVKINVKNSLLTLHKKAFEAINAALDSDNDTTKLNAAKWIIEKIQAVEIGYTDPLSTLKSQCYDNIVEIDFNETKFERLKKEYDL